METKRDLAMWRRGIRVERDSKGEEDFSRRERERRKECQSVLAGVVSQIRRQDSKCQQGVEKILVEQRYSFS